MASPTVLIFSAWSSGMVISNSSSSSMTSSTISSESAPMSSVKEVERVTCSVLTPRFSQTISITRSSTEGTTYPPKADADRPVTAAIAPGEISPASGYVPQRTHAGQGNLTNPRNLTRRGGRCAMVKGKGYGGDGEKERGAAFPASENGGQL